MQLMSQKGAGSSRDVFMHRVSAKIRLLRRWKWGKNTGISVISHRKNFQGYTKVWLGKVNLKDSSSTHIAE